MRTSPDELWTLPWGSTEMDASLATLRRYVESEAQHQIDWYLRKMKPKARASTALRFSAIALFVAGGLAPICKATFPAATLARLPFDCGQAGFLMLGLAAGCVALDRFFGFSTGWMRSITAALSIEKSLEEFRMEWARSVARLRGTSPNEAQLDQLILTVESFSLAIRSQVEHETKVWVAEFASSLSQLGQDLHTRAAEITDRRTC